MADTPTAAQARAALARFSALNQDEYEALDILRAYLALAEKAMEDAERYRTWRDDFAGEPSKEFSALLVDLNNAWTPAEVDATIDAAIAARTQQAGKESR